jgi:vitamin B12 transporter
VRDLIVFQCDAQFNCAPQNVTDATLKGVTVGADLARGATALGASVDLQQPRDDATGNLLPRRARRHGVLTAAHAFGPVRLHAELVASSRRFDDAGNLRPLGGYAIVNLSAEWRLSRGVTLFVRGENVLERDYALAADFATGGARVFGGVRWQL